MNRWADKKVKLVLLEFDGGCTECIEYDRDRERPTEREQTRGVWAFPAAVGPRNTEGDSQIGAAKGNNMACYSLSSGVPGGSSRRQRIDR